MVNGVCPFCDLKPNPAKAPADKASKKDKTFFKTFATEAAVPCKDGLSVDYFRPARKVKRREGLYVTSSKFLKAYTEAGVSDRTEGCRHLICILPFSADSDQVQVVFPLNGFAEMREVSLPENWKKHKPRTVVQNLLQEITEVVRSSLQRPPVEPSPPVPPAPDSGAEVDQKPVKVRFGDLPIMSVFAKKATAPNCLKVGRSSYVYFQKVQLPATDELPEGGFRYDARKVRMKLDETVLHLGNVTSLDSYEPVPTP